MERLNENKKEGFQNYLKYLLFSRILKISLRLSPGSGFVAKIGSSTLDIRGGSSSIVFQLHHSGFPGIS